MKAIILAAGIGNRLKPITDTTPKCLIPVAGKTVLARMLDGLVACGVDEVVLVVGHLRETIREAAGDAHKGVPIRTLDNDAYRQGSVLSLWTARDELAGDVLLMDADVVFDPSLLRRLIESAHPNCVLMDTASTATGEEMMVAARGGRIHQIARLPEPPYDTCGEGVGFVKLSHGGAAALRERMETFLASGANDGCEYEDLLNLFFKDAVVGYEPVGGLPWTELDFVEDIKRAEREIVPRIQRDSQ